MRSNIFRGAIALVALALASTSISAENPRTYKCKVKAFGSPAEQSWIPEQAVFVIDLSKKEAKMALSFDGQVAEEPKPVSSAGGFGRDVVQLSWSFRNVGTDGTREISMDYSVRLNTKRNTATFRAWPRGYDNDITGKAKCSVQ